MITVGAALHVVALILAPVSVIQPVGVVAVPFAVGLAAALSRRVPSRGVIGGMVLTVVATFAFVILADNSVPPRTLTVASTLTAALIVAAAIALAWGVSRLFGPALRCGLLAGIAAIVFGFGSSLIRSVAAPAAADLHLLLLPAALISIVLIIAAVSVGMLAVQQAHAAGPAPVVVGTLTVGDPFTAVVLGLFLLGEGAGLGSATRGVMILCAAAAIAGVALLA